MGRRVELCTLHGVLLRIVFVTMLPDRVDDLFIITICLYLSLSQLAGQDSDGEAGGIVYDSWGFVAYCFCNYVTGQG